MTARSFVVLMADRHDSQASGVARLGITVSRRVGPAVVRARVKRRVREWFRRTPDALPDDKDLVVIARAGAGEASQDAVVRDLDDALGRLLKPARRA